MRDNDYGACSTEKVDMRKWIIDQMVGSPSYMAAIPLTVADLRAEGDEEGADELERLAREAQRQISAVNERADVHTRRRKRPVGGATRAPNSASV